MPTSNSHRSLKAAASGIGQPQKFQSLLCQTKPDTLKLELPLGESALSIWVRKMLEDSGTSDSRCRAALSSCRVCRMPSKAAFVASFKESQIREAKAVMMFRGRRFEMCMRIVKTRQVEPAYSVRESTGMRLGRRTLWSCGKESTTLCSGCWLVHMRAYGSHLFAPE